MKLLLLILGCVSYAAAADLVKHVTDHPEGDVAYSFQAAAYHADLAALPIGVFDSGIGGLTVLEAILSVDHFNNDTLQPKADGKPDFANERFIYFGDQANMPYGNYSAAERTDYLRELILKDAVFLLGRRWFDPSSGDFKYDKPPVKAIVIACNTATAYGIDELREALKKWQVPVFVVGVVEAGARGVQEAHREGAVGILATVGTCASGAYPRVIASTLGLAGRPVPAISQQGSSSLAGVIEGDPSFTETLSDQCAKDARALLSEHQKNYPSTALSTLVLGCTHFPLVQNELRRALLEVGQQDGFRGLIAPDFCFVNPAEWTARELFMALAKARLRNNSDSRFADAFYLSIPNPTRTDLSLTSDGGFAKDFKYGRSPGAMQREDTVNVPMTSNRIPTVSRTLIETKLPEVWKRLTQLPSQ